MTTPRIVYMSEKQYKKLFKMVKWYKEMPSFFYPNDRFHDQVVNQIYDLLPIFSLPELKNETHFINAYDTFTKCGQLFLVMTSNDGEENDTIVQFLPKIK